jgi:hypothetical protein
MPPAAHSGLAVDMQPFAPTLLECLPEDYCGLLTSQVTNFLAVTEDDPDQMLSNRLMRLGATKLAPMSLPQIQGLVTQWSSQPTATPTTVGNAPKPQQGAHLTGPYQLVPAPLLASDYMSPAVGL